MCRGSSGLEQRPDALQLITHDPLSVGSYCVDGIWNIRCNENTGSILTFTDLFLYFPYCCHWWWYHGTVSGHVQIQIILNRCYFVSYYICPFLNTIDFTHRTV